MTMTTLAADIAARREAALAHPGAPPSGQNRRQPFRTEMRAENVERDGKSFYRFTGHACATDRAYEMWDYFGPYDENVHSSAFDVTLAANPDVAFLLNHSGMTMARTKSGTLELSMDEVGLVSVAYCNPQRQDVRDLALAIEDEDITEMSFAFRIVNGRWSDDFLTYTITEVDLDRGDVSAVNYGANPYTDIASRAREVFSAIDNLEGAALRAAYQRLGARLDEAPTAKAGGSVSLARKRLEIEA